MARQIDRKELKNPDQFVSFWSEAGAAAAQNARAIALAVGALLVIGIAAWGASRFMAARGQAASAEFARIERIANAELIPAGDAAKTFDDGLPHFKTNQERVEAAVKEADTFIGKHGGSALKDEAQLLKAKYLLILGKASEAATLYQAVQGSLDPRLRFLAQEGLAYAHEAEGQLDKAVAAFGALADQAQNAGGFYRDRALFHKARLLEKKGDAKQAEAAYKEILEKAPTSALRDEVTNRLATLEKK